MDRRLPIEAHLATNDPGMCVRQEAPRFDSVIVQYDTTAFSLPNGIDDLELRTIFHGSGGGG